MKNASEKTSSDHRQRKEKIKHTVTVYVRQGSIGAGLQECSLAMTKQSEAAKTCFIGHDPGKEQWRHPTMGRLDEGI